jgi:hypothetical protein
MAHHPPLRASAGFSMLATAARTASMNSETLMGTFETQLCIEKFVQNQIGQGAADRGEYCEATEATEKALNSLDADASPQKNRLKGGRNANEKI